MASERNQLVHPLQGWAESIVNNQQCLKDQFRSLLPVLLQRYKRETGNVHDLLRIEDIKRDVLAGVDIPGFEAFRDVFRAISKAEPLPPRKVDLTGPELSPDDKPMSDGVKFHTIAEVTGDYVVSRDVYCQLTQQQREELEAKVDGLHVYCSTNAYKPSIANPSGYWPEGSGGSAGESEFCPGLVMCAHVREFVVKADVKLFPPLEISGKPALDVCDMYSLDPKTTYSFSYEGVSVCESRDDDCVVNAKHLKPFKRADRYGKHVDKFEEGAEIGKKFDGEYYGVLLTGGEVTLTDRRGGLFKGKVGGSLCFRGALEVKNSTCTLLYVDQLFDNSVPICGDLQRHLRDRISFKITGDLVADSDGDHEWTYDGAVHKKPRAHYFIKDTKTVDLNEGHVSRLIDEGFAVDALPSPGIHEYSFTPPTTLKHLRKRSDKVLPNKYRTLKISLGFLTHQDVSEI